MRTGEAITGTTGVPATRPLCSGPTRFGNSSQALGLARTRALTWRPQRFHPDVHIAYGEVTFELTRYDIVGKVTDRDIEVAKKISN